MQFWGIMARLRVSQLDVEMDLKTTPMWCPKCSQNGARKIQKQTSSRGVKVCLVLVHVCKVLPALGVPEAPSNEARIDLIGIKIDAKMVFERLSKLTQNGRQNQLLSKPPVLSLLLKPMENLGIWRSAPKMDPPRVLKIDLKIDLKTMPEWRRNGLKMPPKITSSRSKSSTKSTSKRTQHLRAPLCFAIDRIADGSTF